MSSSTCPLMAPFASLNMCFLVATLNFESDNQRLVGFLFKLTLE